MPTVSTVTAVWNGFTGAPGYSRFNFFELADGAAVNAAGAAVRAFFDAQKLYLGNSWSISVQTTVQHKDLATGDLTGETTMTTAPTSVVGTGGLSVPYAGGSGYVVNWTTGAFWNGRKVRGRTFFAPAIGPYSGDGTISAAVITAATNAGNALVADPTTTLAIWAKKFNDDTPPKQEAGALFPVTGTSVPDRAAQLRTRRT